MTWGSFSKVWIFPQNILGTLSMDLSGVPVKFHGKINPLILANAVVVVIF
jgi:hypothetical protein